VPSVPEDVKVKMHEAMLALNSSFKQLSKIDDMIDQFKGHIRQTFLPSAISKRRRFRSKFRHKLREKRMD